MADRTFRPLQIGDLTVPLPVIQGGMGVGISLSSLASAISEEGGLGTIATVGIGMFEPDVYSNFIEANIRALKKEIRKARAMTKGPLAVNIMVAMTNYADMVKAAIEEEIDLIISGAGLPLDMPKYLSDGCRTKLVPIISSGRAATILCKRWLDRYDHAPDAVVVEGPLAGGHLGFKPEEIEDPTRALELLIPEVVTAVKPFEDRAGKPIPVVAAGGIYTGADILKFERLGASGVQMATRFVTTVECDAWRPSNRLTSRLARRTSASSRAPWACPDAPSGTLSSRRWRRERRPPSPAPTTASSPAITRPPPIASLWRL